jgi:hypothetical protein
MGAGDIYTQAAGATNVNNGGTLAGIIDVTGGAVNIVSGGTLAGLPMSPADRSTAPAPSSARSTTSTAALCSPA